MDADPNATAPPNFVALDSQPADVSPTVHRHKRFRRNVLEWFRKGPRYRMRMNAVLRANMEHARGDRSHD